MALIMFWIPSQAQVIKTITFGGGEPEELFILPEVGALIVKSDGGPKVDMVIPSDQRPDDYKNVDIQVGDIIKMFNGKSMKKVSSIEEVYEALSIGDELKFGIQRGKDMLIEKLTKMDPKDASGQMMIKKFPASGGGGIGNIIADLIDLGLILEEKDGQIFVIDVMTEISSAFSATAHLSQNCALSA